MSHERAVSALGRVPPQNIEAEQSTLGSMMIERQAMEKGVDILRAGDFYRPANAEIFDCFGALTQRNEPSDLITLQEELRKRGKLEDCGGTEYLMALADAVPTAGNMEYYARIVEAKSLMRKLIAASSEIAALGYEDEVSEIGSVLARAEAIVMAIGERRCGMDISQIRDVYSEVYDGLTTWIANNGAPICLEGIQRICVSLRCGELVVLAARPRIGKSCLAMQLLIGAARQQFPAAMISCEMTKQQLAIREVAKKSEISMRTMFSGNLTDKEYTTIAGIIASDYETPLFLVNAVGRNIVEIQAMCRRLSVMGVKLVAIDHLHEVAPLDYRVPDVQHISQVAQGCKDIAVRYNMAVIAVAQLNRGPEKRGGNARPTLQDLRGSGKIEEVAHGIWFLWREMPEQNEGSQQTEEPGDKRDQQEKRDQKGEETKIPEAELIVAKQRMLGEGVAKLRFDGKRFMFHDVTDRYGDSGMPRQEAA